MRQQPNGGATLPIVWAEWYPSVSQLNGNLDYYNAVYASDAIQTVRAGVQWGMMWGTTGGIGGQIPETDRPELMLDSTGKPTKIYDTTLLLKANFPPGTQWYNTTVSPSTVTVLASSNKTMLVNQLNAVQTVSVNGTEIILSPYQVALINTPSSGNGPNTNALPAPTATSTLTLTLVPSFRLPTVEVGKVAYSYWNLPNVAY